MVDSSEYEDCEMEVGEEVDGGDARVRRFCCDVIPLTNPFSKWTIVCRLAVGAGGRDVGAPRSSSWPPFPGSWARG